MGGHLASAGSGIRGRATACSSMSLSCDTERKAKRAIPIIGIEPIVAGPQAHPGGDLDGFMAGAADLKINFVLPLQQDLAVIDSPSTYT